MKDRLKELRKSMGLTQQEFADKIGIQRGTYAKYEVGRNEPIDAVINLICDRCNVREDWLRTGSGDMYIEAKRDDDIDRLISEMLADESAGMKKRLVTAILRLSPEQIDKGIEWIKETFGLSAADADPDVSGTNVGNMAAAVSDLAKRPDEMTREELHAELDRQLDFAEDSTKMESSGTA
ncbi:MAG: helix-turn-helix domain-containing protein [bacterium]